MVPFFSYYDGSPGASNGGESLSHKLYKYAIARLSKTRLQLKNGHYGKPTLRLKNGDYNIRITHADTEKTIHLPTGEYYGPLLQRSMQFGPVVFQAFNFAFETFQLFSFHDGLLLQLKDFTRVVVVLLAQRTNVAIILLAKRAQ